MEVEFYVLSLITLLRWDSFEQICPSLYFICYLRFRSFMNWCSFLGLVAGVYSGLTYAMQEARGTHDWVLFMGFSLQISMFPFFWQSCSLYLLYYSFSSITLLNEVKSFTFELSYLINNELSHDKKGSHISHCKEFLN